MVGRRFFVAPLAASMVAGAIAAAPAAAQTSTALTRLSAGDGTSSTRWSSFPVVSPDGQYVAFNSHADDLVAGDDNGASDVFVYDRDAQVLHVASVSSTEVQGDEGSYVGGVSNDGAVAFSSSATNLVGGDDNGAPDIFVRDIVAGTTERIGNGAADMWSSGGNLAPTISANGNRVLYLSWVPGDFFSGAFELHLHNRSTGNTSVLLGTTTGLDYPVISADGGTVAFESSESHTAEDSDSLKDVYLHDVSSGTKKLVSVDGGASWWAGSPQVSHDGQEIAFQWFHCPPTPWGATCEPDDWDTLVYERADDATSPVAVSSAEVRANDLSMPTAISANGRYVTFWSGASNLVGGDSNGQPDVFVRDRADGQTTRVSSTGSGGDADGASTWSAIGPYAGFVVFESTASNLTSGDDYDTSDIFMRNL